MRPRILPATPDTIAEAARLIRAGVPVALPTETVYGLAGDATDARSVAAIYAAKGRPAFNPLIVHVSDLAMAEEIAQVPPVARTLAAAFWPGPLTLVLPRRTDGAVCDLATAGLATVAVRVPAHPVMRAVIAAAGRPLAAPSANRSGAISPTSAAHVAHSLGDAVALILDGGTAEAGLESSIVAPAPDSLRLLRPGPITAEALEGVAGVPVRAGSASDAIEAPGQLASHYAPAAPVRLDATEAEAGAYLIGFGPVTCDSNLSVAGDLVEAAANLFAALHTADASGRTHILVSPIPHEGLGIAINDRLARAAAR